MAGSRTVRVLVVVGRDNTVDLAFYDRDPETGVETAVSFAAVERAVLTVLTDVPVVIDSADDADLMNWTTLNAPTNRGRVRFQIGRVAGLPTSGEYGIRFTVVDTSGHQVDLIHEDMAEQSVVLEFGATASLP